MAVPGYAITRVEIDYSASSYAGPFTASSGVVDASLNPVVWTGNARTVALTASGQMRFGYIAVSVAPSTAVEPDVPAQGAFYEPVNYISELVEGARYILVAPSAGKAMGTTLSKGSSGYLNSVDVTLNTDKTVYAADANELLEFTLERGTNASSYSLCFTSDDDKTYYLAAPSTSTTLSRTTTKSTSNNVTITQGNSLATILFVKNSRRLNYGTANGGCFQAYASSNASKVLIYRKKSTSLKSANIANAAIVNFVAPANEEVDGAVLLFNSDGSAQASGTGVNDATLHFNIDTAELHVAGQGGVLTDIETLFDDDAETQYYNLQGMRMERPVHGVVIARRGSQTLKVLIRE